MMKALSVGLLAFCGIMTESFIKSGVLGCVVYACLVAVSVTLFCVCGRRRHG